MSLAEFKNIFFWEYLHRLLGRLIGVAFALPLLWFAWKRAIPKGYGWRLTALFALGGLQGAIGWWMVASRSEEHTSELQSLMRISYAVFCLKKKRNTYKKKQST